MNLYRKNRKNFFAWIASILTMPYVAHTIILDVTPNLKFDWGEIIILSICWVIVSGLTYKFFLENTR